MVKRLRVLEEIKKAMALLQQPHVYGAWLAALTSAPEHHSFARCEASHMAASARSIGMCLLLSGCLLL